MYLSFFRLSEFPFNLTPDPRFLFMTRSHREAFDHLMFGIKQRRGFIEVVGGVGTGKTTLCRALLEELDGKVPVALILNSHLSALELLRAINEEFGIDVSGRSRKALIDALNRFLIGQLAAGGNACLILDECQNLTLSVLEQVRMLSNLETESEKLLQIVMVGQPEFHDTLKTPALQALDERIQVRAFLEPLTWEDTRAFVQHRLTVAGSRGDIVFTDRALRVVFDYSQGIPRRINTACDRCLLVAYARETCRVTKAHARQAVQEIQAGPRPRRMQGRGGGGVSAARVMAGVGGGAAILAVVVGLILGEGTLLKPEAPSPSVPEPMSPALEAAVIPEPLEAKKEMAPPPLVSETPEASLPASEEPALASSVPPPNPSERLFTALPGLAPPTSVSRIADVARSLGADARQVTLSWEILARFQRPCILELSPADGSPPRYGVLRGISELGALIRERDRIPRWVSREELGRTWFGIAWILTVGPRKAEALIPGSGGEGVLRLQDALERLGYLDEHTPGLFDEATRRGVMAFQRDVHLPVDGQVGAQTAGMILQLLDGEGETR